MRVRVFVRVFLVLVLLVVGLAVPVSAQSDAQVERVRPTNWPDPQWTLRVGDTEGEAESVIIYLDAFFNDPDDVGFGIASVVNGRINGLEVLDVNFLDEDWNVRTAGDCTTIHCPYLKLTPLYITHVPGQADSYQTGTTTVSIDTYDANNPTVVRVRQAFDI